MRLATRLHLCFGLMLAVCLGAATLSVWSSRHAHQQIERIDLAQDVYAAHLKLAASTYELFKQYGDALITGESPQADRRVELISEIRGQIRLIRERIGAEIELVGAEEIEELETIATLEKQIETLISALDGYAAAHEPDAFITNWRELSQILHAGIDRDFRSTINMALEEEAEEVAETREEADFLILVYELMAVVTGLAALAAAGVSLVVMRRHFTEPIERLVTGIRQFSDGDMSRRISLSGSDELTEVANAFDRMADRVAAQTEELRSQNVTLEEAVKDRTERLEFLLEEARRTEVNRRRLLADVSHELRTPLTIIKGEAAIALRGADKSPDVYKEALTRAREAADHTARLVDDVLTVARQESGQLRLNLEDADLLFVVRQAIDTAGEDVEVVTDLKMAVVRADPTRVRQALLVLLDNANRHGGQHVVVRIDQAIDGFRIAVEDDGLGLSDPDKVQAFERFFRGSNAADRYAEGVGLGLPVARSIIEAHGGTISLDDRPGGGLIAAMVLPRRMPLKAVS